MSAKRKSTRSTHERKPPLQTYRDTTESRIQRLAAHTRHPLANDIIRLVGLFTMGTSFARSSVHLLSRFQIMQADLLWRFGSQMEGRPVYTRRDRGRRDALASLPCGRADRLSDRSGACAPIELGLRIVGTLSVLALRRIRSGTSTPTSAGRTRPGKSSYTAERTGWTSSIPG